MLSDLIYELFGNWRVQLYISIISLSLYLINRNVIKTKFVLRLRIKEILLFMLPYFNIAFLMLNVVIVYINIETLRFLLLKPIRTMMVKTKKKQTSK